MYAWTRTCRGLALTFSSRYPITRKPFPPSICSCMATELFSSSTRNASRVALQDTLCYSCFCMFPFYASLFPLLSRCILICNHCLLANWQIVWLQLTWCGDGCLISNCMKAHVIRVSISIRMISKREQHRLCLFHPSAAEGKHKTQSHHVFYL